MVYIMNFLIIDDSVAMRKMVLDEIGLIRNKEKDIFFEAESYAEIEETLKKEKIDILILDWNIPNFDNLKLIHSIRREKLFNEMVIIIITHDNKQEQIMQAIKCGVDSFIIKPFTKDALHEKIKEFDTK